MVTPRRDKYNPTKNSIASHLRDLRKKQLKIFLVQFWVLRSWHFIRNIIIKFVKSIFDHKTLFFPSKIHYISTNKRKQTTFANFTKIFHFMWNYLLKIFNLFIMSHINIFTGPLLMLLQPILSLAQWTPSAVSNALPLVLNQPK